MKRLLLPLPALAVLAATGCGSATTSGSGDGPTVAAGFYPLAWTAEQVAGDGFEVVNLTSPGQESHDLELSVRQTATVGDADLVLYLHGFQPAVDSAVDQVADGEVLDAEEVVDLRAAEESEEEHAEHADDEEAHEHGDEDPHFWLDPLRMADLGDAVADRLAAIDPDSAGEYAGNAEDLRGRLEDLDASYAETLASCERDTVVVSHDAFGYLEKYGVHTEPIVGLSPDAEPTPATLAELERLIRDEGITTVFTETLVSPRIAETLAAEAGVETAVLDPVEGLGPDTSGEDYLSLMEANLAALAEANGC